MIEIIWKKIQMMPNHCSKVILAAKRHAAKKAREMVQRKTVMGGGGLPGKLSDCSEQDPAKCEVYLSRRFGRGTAKQGVTESFKRFCHYVVRNGWKTIV
jgi:DNA gyrase/topoisomerase IV subunit B